MPILPSKQTIPHSIYAAAQKYRERIAIRGEDGNSLAFRELEIAARQCAAAFIARGIRKGDRVAIWAPNSARWIVATLGLQSAGATLVSLNTRLKGPEAGYILRKSGARFLLTVSDFLGVDYPTVLGNERPETVEDIMLLEGDYGGVPWDTFLDGGKSISPAQIDERLDQLLDSDISDIFFTSGTTGHPKGAVTTHGQNVRVYQRFSATLHLGPDDKALIVIPFFHTFGYKAGWLAMLMNGGSVSPHAVYDSEALLKRIARERITALSGPPAIFLGLLTDKYKNYDISSLRVSTTGGAPVPVSLVQRMHTELGIDNVVNAYGLTETCGTVSMCHLDDDDETIAHTAGCPLPTTEVRIVDEDGKDLPPNTPGEVLVRGDCVMQGYFGDVDATNTTIDKDGWLHTGDIAVQNERGYLTITDRKKDVIIVGGFNVYPAEVEQMLADHPKILQAAIIGMPDERLGEVPEAYVILRPDETLSEEEIIAWSRDNMANFKVPRSVKIVSSLPTNASGKVQKFILRNRGSNSK